MDVPMEYLTTLRRDLLRYAAHRVIAEDKSLRSQVLASVGRVERLIQAMKRQQGSLDWAMRYSIGLRAMGVIPD